jgi:hypothetical protein
MTALPHSSQMAASLVLAAMISGSFTSCRSTHAVNEASIEFTRVPPASDGSPDELEMIEGRVRGALPGQRIVLFALSGVWWVQPMTEHPFTAIQNDSTWKNSTHPGAAYAALLVDSQYRPPVTADSLPEKGGPVLAVNTVRGTPPRSAPKTIQFSGYQWELRPDAADPGESEELGGPGNVWTDKQGFLHLRVAKQRDRWVNAAVRLSRSLGYGSYRFVVRDVSRLEPAAVFAMFTFDYQGPSREMDMEISRWGEPEGKNAQYIIQPYVVPANTVRFTTPAGPLTYWMNWQPGRASFKTTRGSASGTEFDVVAEHVFTSGVPTAGNERVHMNLYAYGSERHPVQHEFEAVIEKFEFLP